MITVPVLRNFDNNDQIGVLTIDETKLPENDANFVFSIGYMIGGDEVVPRSKTAYYGKYKLVCVSLMSDQEYLKFLNNQ